MARMRLLDLTRPFTSLIPEVSVPYQKVDFQDRIMYTVAAAIIYELLAEVTLVGASDPMYSPDPISWLRAALGMSHGTGAELGVLPIVLSGVVVQGLAGLRKIQVSLDLRTDRALFQTLQKFVAFGIAAFFSVLLAFAPGFYGEKTQKPFLVAGELFLGSGAVILLDEVLSKGYGFVPGFVAFPLITTSQKFTWQLFGMERVSVPRADYTVIYGVVPNFFANFSARSYSYTFTELVFRTTAPNLVTLACLVAVFAATLYCGFVRLNLPIRSTRMRAPPSQFPLRLLYTAGIPLAFSLSVVAAFLLASYALALILGNESPVAQVLGQWNASAQATGGLASLLVPEFTGNVFVQALRVATYSGALVLLSTYVAGVWVRSSGSAPNDLAKQFKEQSIVLVGKRDVTVAKELRRIVPVAATTGAIVLGLIVGVADTLGPAGSGATAAAGALVMISAFEILSQENGGQGTEVLQRFMS